MSGSRICVDSWRKSASEPQRQIISGQFPKLTYGTSDSGAHTPQEQRPTSEDIVARAEIRKDCGEKDVQLEKNSGANARVASYRDYMCCKVHEGAWTIEQPSLP